MRMRRVVGDRIARLNEALGRRPGNLSATEQLRGASGLFRIESAPDVTPEQVRAALKDLPGFKSVRPVVALWQQSTTPVVHAASLRGSNMNAATSALGRAMIVSSSTSIGIR